LSQAALYVSHLKPTKSVRAHSPKVLLRSTRPMRAVCVVAFFILLAGASAETDGCAPDPSVPDACREGIPLADSASLLQVKATERVQDQSEAAALTQNAAVTQRCSDSRDDDCAFTPWTAWSGCSKTCGSGIQTRTRQTINPEKCKEVCLKEAETCNVHECQPDSPCVVGDWSDWGLCDCDHGVRTRSRKVTSVEERAGECPCTEEAGPCGADECGGTIVKRTVHVCGKVQDVADHTKKIVGAQVTTNGEEPQTTNNYGEFCFDLPEGPVQFTVTAEGYDTEEGVSREVVKDKDIDVIEMSKPLGGAQWRIVLKWHNKPKDLDSWTTFGKGTAEEQKKFEEYARVGGYDQSKSVGYTSSPDKMTPSACTMNWIWKHGPPSPDQETVTCSTSGFTAFMDQDNTDITRNPYAETTTLSNVDGTKCGDDCKIHFCVYQYEPNGYYTKPKAEQIQNRESGATVDVYHGAGKVDTFEIEKGDGMIVDVPEGHSGTSMWFVFSIDAKTNEVTQCKDPSSECAKVPCGQHHAR